MSIEKQDDEGLVSRWSKRKRGIEVEALQEKISDEAQAEIDEAQKIQFLENQRAAEEIDLDSIDEESDLSIFMKDGVPEALKKQALAVLWRSNPVFANVDGLNDYDDDFGNSDLIMKTFKSAYQAGKGYLQKEPEILPDDGDDTLVAQMDEDDTLEGVDEVSKEDIDVENHEVALDEEGSIEVAEEITDEEVEQEINQPKVSLRERLMQEV